MGRFLGIHHGVMRIMLLVLVKQLKDLFHAFKAQKSAPHHQQRRDQPGHKGADQQRSGHQDGLVQQRALGHSPDHGQLPVGLHSRDLLGIECQIVAQHAGRLLHRHLGLCGHVIENRRTLACRGLGHQGHVVQQASNIV